MSSDDVLKHAARAISEGGQETLLKPPLFPCSDQTHEPFFVADEPLQLDADGDLFLSGAVRTSGSQFSGDRTDIHDVLSLIWGAVLRAFGISSTWMVDEQHAVVPDEIGARHLLLRQCPWKVTDGSFRTARRSLNAWTTFAFHMLNDVFQWDRGRSFSQLHHSTTYPTEYPRWANNVIRYLRNPTDVKVSRRRFPLWIYFSSQKRGITVVRLANVRISCLRTILLPFAPKSAPGENAIAIFANGISNAVSLNADRRARRILSMTEDKCERVLVLPLDSHCLFIGDKTIVAVRGEYGREEFDDERKKMIARRSVENQVLFAECTISWKTPLNAGDLEDLCLDLIRREPGVVRAKPVGSVYDRDGGRDILIDWQVPDVHAASTSVGSADNANDPGTKGTSIVRVIAQVKSRSRSLSKKDVQDIRDTLDHHGAEGFLLIGHPQLSTALVDHLDKLREIKPRTEWWESRDIEERLRRHPDIAARYPRIVALQATR